MANNLVGAEKALEIAKQKGTSTSDIEGAQRLVNYWKRQSSTEIDLSKAPTISPNVGDVSALISGLSAGFTGDQATTQNALQQKMGEVAKTLPEQKTTGIASILGGFLKERQETRAAQPSSAELWKSTLAEFGFSPESFQKQQTLIGQLVDYQKQMADLEAQKQQSLLGAEQRMMGYQTDILRGEQGLIERQYNSRIAAKGAQASVVSQQYELERGMFQDAVSMTNQIVQLATYDQQQKLADLDWAMDTYTDIFSIMDSAEKTQWDRAYTLAKDELDTAKEENTNKINLMLEAAKAGINLGWSMDYIKSKSLEELTAEASPRIAAKAGETKADWQLRDVNGVLYRVNPDTGAYEKVVGEPGGEFTAAQQITFDTNLMKQITDKKGTFWEALQSKQKLSKLADIAVVSGVSFEGFKSALLSKGDIIIDQNNDVWDKIGWARGTKLGNLDEVKNKFTQTNITSTGNQDELNSILFGEEGEF